MPRPIALCVELLDVPPEARFVRCVADIGRRHALGLGIDALGHVTWQSREGLACELFATADERLGLLRPGGAAAVSVHRAGRSLQVPHDKPVILLDQDELQVGNQRLRLHVHGLTDGVRPPAPLATSPLRRAAAIAATAVALGAAVVACKKGNDDSDAAPIDVREQPPKMAAPPPSSAMPANPEGDAGLDAAADGPDSDAADASDAWDGGEEAAPGRADKADASARRAPPKPHKIEVKDWPPYVE